MPSKLFLSIALSLLEYFAFAQEVSTEKERKHFASFTFAYGIVPQGAAEDNISEGHVVPATGADYLFRIAPKWEVGIMVDYELAKYVIPRKEGLIRERAFIATGVIAYNILPQLSVFGGGGVEIEKHKNLGIARLGIEYSFPLKNYWVIPVGFFGDFKEGYQNYSFSVGIGRSF